MAAADGSSFPLGDAYAHCRRVTRREAKNFYYAFITLPAAKRRAIYAAYAFCRLCDDAVDAEAPDAAKLDALARIAEGLEMAMDGHPRGPVFTALAHTASVYDIPRAHFQDVIKGMEMDLTVHRYESFEELKLYCYRAASVVGLICLQVFGYRGEGAKMRAVDLGLAMQLTNILRDVPEDLARGRVYLPQDELRRFGYSEAELRSRVRNGAQREMAAFQVARARELFESGVGLLPHLSRRSRGCPAVLAAIYTRILDRLQANDYNIFGGRISLSGREKALVMATAWFKSLLLLPQPPEAS